jgi:hypothetical protein
MFQCKTTIFKSECASDLYHPVWNHRDDPHEMFQFEMMIPEAFDNDNTCKQYFVNTHMYIIKRSKPVLKYTI